ncbi:MAG: hypothetical protein IKQ31_01395 [Clostridia bacterium]|nr:hypothetical protein [Clostridia bacterium]
MGYGNNKNLSDIGDVMQRIAEIELRETIQPASDEFFTDIFEEMADNISTIQDPEKQEERITNIENFVSTQLKLAENNVYFPRKIERNRSKKPKLVITAEPILKSIFEESMTKAFDKNIKNINMETLYRMFGLYHLLNNMTQTAFDNVISKEQKNFKRQRRKKLEERNNIYYKEIEVDSETLNKN